MTFIRQAFWTLAIVCGLLLTDSSLLGAPTNKFGIIEIARPGFVPYDEVPVAFTLQGIVIDQQAQALAGAIVEVAGRSAKTGTDGRFTIKGKVSSAAQVTIRHPSAVTMQRTARAFYSGEGGQSEIVLTKYTESFRVTPSGGLYRGREMTLDVPAGAVRTPVVVRAAILPPDLAYDDTDELQMRRVAAVALTPEGLSFSKPVRLRVPNIFHGTLPAGDVALMFDERTGRYAPAPGASVQRDGNHTTFTLNHFSRYASGNPSEGVERKLVKNTPDLNGDGKITTQDAEFVVILSGGDHGAQWVKSTGSSSAVMRTRSSTSSTSSTATKGASGGVSYGGVGVEVSSEVSKTEAEEVASSVGNGTSGGASQTVEFKLATPEYETDCRYLLRWYEYWRVRKWDKITPTDKEWPALQSSYDARTDQSNEWGYFDIVGSSSITVGGTLNGGDKVAVRKTANGWEYYRLRAEYVARVPKGMHVINCDVGAPNEDVAEAKDPDAARFFGGGSGMASAAFDGSTTIRYLGWGVLPDSLPDHYTNMECRVETAGEVTVTAESEEASEETASKTSGESSSTSAEAKIEIPVVGVEVGGGVSASKAKETARTRASSYASKFTNQVSTTVRWEINDPHKPQLVHRSDHDLHKLHLLLETRSWQFANEDRIPKQVRQALGSGRSYVATAGGGMVMRDTDGTYLVAGPPVITQKEIGFMLVRIAERPCPGMPTTTPGDSSRQPEMTPTESGERKPVATPGSRGTSTTPAEKPKAVITPGPGEYRAPNEGAGSRVYTPRGNMENYTAVSFTALDGETVISRRAIGDVQSVTFVAIDGARMPEEEKKSRVTTDDTSIRFDAGAAVGVASILIGGSAGTIELLASSSPVPSRPTSTVAVEDGAIDVRGGSVRETVRVPEAMTDLSVAPDQHRVSINNQPVESLALRKGEIAVAGQGVPMPVNGQSTIAVTSPSQATVTGQVSSWGFTLHVQPVTRVGQTVPVGLRLYGIRPDMRVRVEFRPGPGQIINPMALTLSGAQAAAGQPVANLTAQIPGTQELGVHVTKVEPPGTTEP